MWIGWSKLYIDTHQENLGEQNGQVRIGGPKLNIDTHQENFAKQNGQMWIGRHKLNIDSHQVNFETLEVKMSGIDPSYIYNRQLDWSRLGQAKKN